MKLLISNQHGAIVMALMPFLYAITLTHDFIWQTLFLFLAWIAIYLMSYPFLALFKGRNLELYRKWTVIYALTGLIVAIPALYYNPKILYFTPLFLPLIGINIYYTKTKNERSLFNDLSAILIFALVGIIAYYFPQQQVDLNSLKIASYPSLFFIGSTLYVKSVLRERKNPIYYWGSIIFHLSCIGLPLIWQNITLSLAFILPTLRAIVLPKYKLSVKQTGIIEFIVSLVFFLSLIIF